MPGPSVLIPEVAALVQQEGFPVLLDSYRATPAIWPQFCRTVPNAAAYAPFVGHKQLAMVGAQPLVETPLGQSLSSSNMGPGKTVLTKIRKFAREISFPREVFLNPQWRRIVGGQVTAAALGWGRYGAMAKDQFVAGMLMKGTLTAGSRPFFDNSFGDLADSNAGFIYDGQPMFDGAHTIYGGSSTYSNISTSLALSATNLETAEIAMTATNAKDERGQQILVMPDTLIVPPGLARTANVLVNSELVPGSGNNDINTYRGKYRVVVNPFLTDDATQWILTQSGEFIEAIDSGEPELRVRESADGQSIVVEASTYFGAACVDWRFGYSADKADS